jgi:hypothetical protein
MENTTNARGRPRQPRTKTNTLYVGAYFRTLRQLEDAARRAAGRQPLSQATLADKLGTIQTVMQRFEQGDRGESLVAKLTEHWGVDANVVNKLVLGQLPDGTPATAEGAIELATQWYNERDHEFVEAASMCEGCQCDSKQEAVELFEHYMNER